MAQAADFFAVVLVLCALELGMASELGILKRLASVEVRDSRGPVVRECGGLLATSSRRWSNVIGSWELVTVVGSYRCRCQIAVSGASPAGNVLR